MPSWRPYIRRFSASEKLDEYIQLKKTNELVIDQLVQSVSINGH